MEKITLNTDIKSNFEEYGFKNPKEFKGEILREVYGFYIGYAVWGETLKSCRWNKYGVDLEDIEIDGFGYGADLEKLNS